MYYCKCSITNAGSVSKNEVNFFLLPYKQSIVLPLPKCIYITICTNIWLLQATMVIDDAYKNMMVELNKLELTHTHY